jgi:hypothetical protein
MRYATKKDVTEAIRKFESSKRTAVDYQELLLAGAKAMQQGTGIGGAAFSDAVSESVAAFPPSSVSTAEKVFDEARNQLIEECAVAAEHQDRSGREWVHDSLWHKILKRAGDAVRTLKTTEERTNGNEAALRNTAGNDRPAPQG